MGVQISVILRDNVEDSQVNVSGFDLLPLNNIIARKFGIITHERGAHWPLWDVCNSIFGRYPDWWHTKDNDREWGEYKALRDQGYEVEEVSLEKKPIRARIVGIESKPSALATRRRRNTSDSKGNFILTLSESVSLEHSRTTSDEWAIGSETKVGVEIGGELAQAKTTVEQTVTFGYTRGIEKTKARGQAIEVSDAIEVELNPGEERIASLNATKGAILVDITYACRPMGQAMFSFAQKHHNGKRDHLVDIHDVLNRLGREDSIEVIERTSLGFVSDGVAELANA